jgi:hypothetical protein
MKTSNKTNGLNQKFNDQWSNYFIAEEQARMSALDYLKSLLHDNDGKIELSAKDYDVRVEGGFSAIAYLSLAKWAENDTVILELANGQECHINELPGGEIIAIANYVYHNCD